MAMTKSADVVINDRIISAMLRDRFLVNDHWAYAGDINVSHVALFTAKEGEEHVVFVPHVAELSDASYEFVTVNKIVLGADGHAHLSSLRVGGILLLQFTGSIQNAIEYYNKHPGNWGGYFTLLTALVDAGEDAPTICRENYIGTRAKTPLPLDDLSQFML